MNSKDCGNADPFLAPKKGIRNLDRYLIRSSILAALKEHIEELSGTVLDVGCGSSPYRGLLLSDGSRISRYVGLDQENNPIHENQPDIVWRQGVIPLESSTVDCALCTEVLEHCPEPTAILKEIARVLKPRGILILTTPFLWPLHEIPFDEYRYTPFALERILKNAGFDEIRVNSLGGWDASLAQMIGLWARRRMKNRFAKVFWSCVVYPLHSALMWSDRQREWDFQDGIMFTGLVGTARKEGKCDPVE